MKVDFTGVVTNLDGIPLGGFFMFDLSSGGAFGICVAAADNTRAVIALPTSASPQRQIGWLQTGGLHQTFIHFPEAVLRPALSSATQAGSSAAGSVLICAGQKRFVRGYENRGYQYRTFNVETGLVEEVPSHDVVYFTQWSVGLLVDDRFEELYSYPPNAADGA
jgi:hypothetical protein